jgi:hypothetical protein
VNGERGITKLRFAEIPKELVNYLRAAPVPIVGLPRFKSERVSGSYPLSYRRVRYVLPVRGLSTHGGQSDDAFGTCFQKPEPDLFKRDMNLPMVQIKLGSGEFVEHANYSIAQNKSELSEYRRKPWNGGLHFAPHAQLQIVDVWPAS